jgi:CheY-like chemotaxis protein
MLSRKPQEWKVLIVDDEIHNSGVLEYVLNYHGARTWKAASGAAGLELLRSIQPTLLLLDIQMPQMSGYDVLKVIRQDKNFKSLPVIAVTSYAMQEDRERALAAGFDGYIVKPVQVESFVQQITDILAQIKR